MTMNQNLSENVLGTVHQMLKWTELQQRGTMQLRVAAALVQDVAYDPHMVQSRALMFHLLTIFIDLERAARDIEPLKGD